MIDYGFEHAPFGVTPDPRMVFRHKQFEEAWDALARGIVTGKGFIVITGEVGAGKTTLMRSLLASDYENLDTAAILNTGLDPDGLLRAVADDLGIAVGEAHDRKTLIDALYEHLMRTYAQKRQTAIFIDEAQHLSFESFELLRMISNLETESEKLVQIILFGQDPLREILARPEMVQLRSRIAVHRHLKPLDARETGEYLTHRLAAAGASIPISFAPSAVKRLHKSSGGLPRVINILADGALRAASQDDAQVVKPVHVQKSEKEFADILPAAPSPALRLARMAPALGAWAVLLTVLWYVMHRPHAAEAPGAAPVAAQQQIVREVIEQKPGEGAMLRTFFASAGLDLPYSASALETIRPDVLAASHGRAWIQIPCRPELLSAVGMTTLVRLSGVGGEELAILKPVAGNADSVAVVHGASEELVPWQQLALDPSFPASYILPADFPTQVYAEGATGENVTRLQNALYKLDRFHGVVNGLYGPTTVRAVRDFQAAEKIPVDGVAGPITFAMIVARGAWEIQSEKPDTAPAR